ncbi:MAG: hypothetical protein P9M03_05185 [Candidatus Theseobacter exili]|nr:hypothetical protein [Candidatus Theseobacter exili]
MKLGSIFALIGLVGLLAAFSAGCESCPVQRETVVERVVVEEMVVQ